MATRRVVVASRVGLHARPAATFVRTAAAQAMPVTIAVDGREPVDARSILAVLGLAVEHGQSIELHAEGHGAERALDALEAVLAVDHDGT